MDDNETVVPRSRSEWRNWLVDNHDRSAGVWLMYFKRHTGEPTVTYDEVVEEVLCFGWIDSRVKTVDDRCYLQWMTPRKPGSVWSKVNKARIEKLIAEGQMTPAGLKAIDAARADGSWTLLDAAEDLRVAPDLQAALDALPPAADNFAAFSRTAKRNILWWIESARRAETRARRIAETVAAAAENRKVRN